MVFTKPYVKMLISVQTRVRENSNTQYGGIVIDSEGFVYIVNLFVCRNQNKFTLILAVICCFICHWLEVSRLSKLITCFAGVIHF